MTTLLQDRAVATNPMLPRPYAVRRIWKETADTFTFEIEPADGEKCMTFEPGQFNMLYVFGVGEVPISISGDPAREGVLTHTVRAVGAVTQAMSKLRPGDIVGVRGPIGTCWPHKQFKGKDIVIVAGGIGLPPLRPAIYEIGANRADYGEVSLLYGARAPHELMYQRVPIKERPHGPMVDELDLWRERFNMHVAITVDTAEAGWTGNVGVVTTLIPKALFEPSNTVAFMVGPEIMMRFTIMALQNRGLTNEQMYVSMERNMKCAIGLCGHCQFGPSFICKDGPVFRFDKIAGLFATREV